MGRTKQFDLVWSRVHSHMPSRNNAFLQQEFMRAGTGDDVLELPNALPCSPQTRAKSHDGNWLLAHLVTRFYTTLYLGNGELNVFIAEPQRNAILHHLLRLPIQTL